MAWRPDESDSAEFADDVAAKLTVVFRGAGKQAASQLGIDWDFLDPLAEQFGQERGAEMVGMTRDGTGNLIPNPRAEWVIDQSTRDAVRDMLSQALAEGWSYQDFASQLETSGIFERERAMMVARTEIALAQNSGRVASMRESGVQWVVVSDGDSDEACQNADGEIWTIDEALDNPLEHPNCLRSFRPATREEEQEAEEMEAA